LLPFSAATHGGLHDSRALTLLRQPELQQSPHEMTPANTLSRLSSRSVLYSSIAADFLIGLTKFTAAFFSGSSAMLSEGIRSIVDTGNGILVLYGLRRATVHPDHEHRLGYSREIYFWSFVVAVLLFAVGAGISLYQGILQILKPEPVQHVAVNYAVLGICLIFDVNHMVTRAAKFQSERRLLTASDINPQKQAPAIIYCLAGGQCIHSWHIDRDCRNLSVSAPGIACSRRGCVSSHRLRNGGDGVTAWARNQKSTHWRSG
jgi:hypothetical protein